MGDSLCFLGFVTLKLIASGNACPLIQISCYLAVHAEVFFKELQQFSDYTLLPLLPIPTTKTRYGW